MTMSIGRSQPKVPRSSTQAAAQAGPLQQAGAAKNAAATRAAEISSFAPGSGVERRYSVKFLQGIDQRMKLAGVPTELASALSRRFATMSRSELDREGRVVDGILASSQPGAGLEVYEHQARLSSVVTPGGFRVAPNAEKSWTVTPPNGEAFVFGAKGEKTKALSDGTTLAVGKGGRLTVGEQALVRSTAESASRLGSGLGALSVSIAAGGGELRQATGATKAGLELVTGSPKAKELQALLSRAGQSPAPSSRNDPDAERAALLVATGARSTKLTSPKTAAATMKELTTLADNLRGAPRSEAIATMQQSLGGARGGPSTEPAVTAREQDLHANEAVLGPGGLRPDEGLLGGVGAEKLGEPVGEGAGIAEGLLGGGKGAMDGLKDMLGVAAGAEGLLPGRGPDLSAGPGGIFGGLGRDGVTGGVPDPFAGQGKTPLGENAGRGADPRVSEGDADAGAPPAPADGTSDSGGQTAPAGGTSDSGGQTAPAGGTQGSGSQPASAGSGNAGQVSSPSTGAKVAGRILNKDGSAYQTSDFKRDVGRVWSSLGGTSSDTGSNAGVGIRGTPDPERGDGSIGGSPRQQAEFKAMVAAATRKQRAPATKAPDWVMGDSREGVGGAKDMAAAEAVKEQFGQLGDRTAPYVLTDNADADLGLPKQEIKEVDTLGGDPAGDEPVGQPGPKPKP